jgi:hypothetical protein
LVANGASSADMNGYRSTRTMASFGWSISDDRVGPRSLPPGRPASLLPGRPAAAVSVPRRGRGRIDRYGEPANSFCAQGRVGATAPHLPSGAAGRQASVGRFVEFGRLKFGPDDPSPAQATVPILAPHITGDKPLALYSCSRGMHRRKRRGSVSSPRHGRAGTDPICVAAVPPRERPIPARAVPVPEAAQAHCGAGGDHSRPLRHQESALPRCRLRG